MSIEWIGDSINDLSVVSMALRMVLSMVCSGVIGLERGRANQPAGMRTYMLVSSGASIVMITGDRIGLMKQFMEEFGRMAEAQSKNDCHEAVEEAENHLQKSELLKLEESQWI